MSSADEGQLSLTDAMSMLEHTEDRLLANSLQVAERFGKLHKNVLRSIEGIECSREFYRLNFEPVTYMDRRGLEQPMFRMTRDGFSLLVMGFSGTKAMLWKERYIQAFNMLEAAALKQRIEHAEARGRSKTVRIAATDSYKEHGATEWFHYVNNTDAIYEIMFGGSASQLRRRWKLHPAANLRDHLSTAQLNTVIQIENAVTLQLEARRVFHPDDQLKIVRHVARSYKALIDAPMPELVSSASAANGRPKPG
jgi:Rha family phage regulatory protein